jgi:tetratricopeptide (TPR) repeat protein
LTLGARRDVQIEDPGGELLDRATNIWERFGRIALIGLGVIVVAGVIGFLTMRARARTEEEAAGKLAQANSLDGQGEYAQSLELARQVATQHGSSASGKDAHRLVGDNAYWTGDYKTAITEYKAYLKHHKKGLLADAARRSLAYALESDRQFAEAATTYESLIGVFDPESSAEFLADAARCYRELGQRDKAVQTLERLIDEFGASTYATMARIQLAELRAAQG